MNHLPGFLKYDAKHILLFLIASALLPVINLTQVIAIIIQFS